jgi:hypothetical protein
MGGVAIAVQVFVKCWRRVTTHLQNALWAPGNNNKTWESQQIINWFCACAPGRCCIITSNQPAFSVAAQLVQRPEVFETSALNLNKPVCS